MAVNHSNVCRPLVGLACLQPTLDLSTGGRPLPKLWDLLGQKFTVEWRSKEPKKSVEVQRLASGMKLGVFFETCVSPKESGICGIKNAWVHHGHQVITNEIKVLGTNLRFQTRMFSRKCFNLIHLRGGHCYLGFHRAKQQMREAFSMRVRWSFNFTEAKTVNWYGLDPRVVKWLGWKSRMIGYEDLDKWWIEYKNYRCIFYNDIYISISIYRIL